jgi:hypothetical protein
MRLNSLSLAVLTALGAVAQGVDYPETAGSKSAPYQLQHRSSFDLTDNVRPPFWPIGWVKRAKGVAGQAPTAPKIKVDEKAFVVSSILLGNPSLAVINGRAYTEGEILKMPRGSQAPRIRVHRIWDGGVQLQADEQLISAMLRRPELENKNREEALLSPDDH